MCTANCIVSEAPVAAATKTVTALPCQCIKSLRCKRNALPYQCTASAAAVHRAVCTAVYSAVRRAVCGTTAGAVHAAAAVCGAVYSAVRRAACGTTTPPAAPPPTGPAVPPAPPAGPCHSRGDGFCGGNGTRRRLPVHRERSQRVRRALLVLLRPRRRLGAELLGLVALHATAAAQSGGWNPSESNHNR